MIYGENLSTGSNKLYPINRNQLPVHHFGSDSSMHECETITMDWSYNVRLPEDDSLNFKPKYSSDMHVGAAM